MAFLAWKYSIILHLYLFYICIAATITMSTSSIYPISFTAKILTFLNWCVVRFDRASIVFRVDMAPRCLS